MEPKPPPPVRLRARLREGARPAFAVFATILAASAVFTFTRPKVYEATATIELLSHRDRIRTEDGTLDHMAGPIDFRPLLALAESDELVHQVAARLVDDEMPEPATGGPAPSRSPVDALKADRMVRPYRLNQMLAVSFRHSDPQHAVRVANCFVEELASSQRRREIDAAREQMDTLMVALTKQRDKAEAAAETLAQARSTRDWNDRTGTEAQKRAFEVEDIELNRLLAQARATSMTAPPSLIGRLIPATPPAPGDYVSPDHLLHLGLGALLGLIAAFLTARLRSPRLAT